MMRSMTGFGQAKREINGNHYAVEVQSVNNRYYKGTVRLPEMWSFLEPEVDQRLRQQLHRGSIYFSMRMKSLSADAAYEINIAALQRYIEQLDVIRPDQSDVTVALDLAVLLSLPGVCNPPEPDDLAKKSKTELMALIDEAVAALVKMRGVEGAALAKDLLANCDAVVAQLKIIKGRAGVVVVEYHQRLAKRVAELTAAVSTPVTAQDLAREVAVYAERCDVAEEITRLEGHLQQFRAVLGGEDQPGRKLEFIAQEMLREANTIASKSSDGEIVRAVVEIKTAVDRIKEQTQNVE